MEPVGIRLSGPGLLSGALPLRRFTLSEAYSVVAANEVRSEQEVDGALVKIMSELSRRVSPFDGPHQGTESAYIWSHKIALKFVWYAILACGGPVDFKIHHLVRTSLASLRSTHFVIF